MDVRILSSSLQKQIDDNFDQCDYTLEIDNGSLYVKVQPVLETFDVKLYQKSILFHTLTISVLSISELDVPHC